MAHFVNFLRLYNLKHFRRIKIKVIDLQKVLYHRKLYSAGKKTDWKRNNCSCTLRNFPFFWFFWFFPIVALKAALNGGRSKFALGGIRAGVIRANKVRFTGINFRGWPNFGWFKIHQKNGKMSGILKRIKRSLAWRKNYGKSVNKIFWKW